MNIKHDHHDMRDLARGEHYVFHSKCLEVRVACLLTTYWGAMRKLGRNIVGDEMWNGKIYRSVPAKMFSLVLPSLLELNIPFLWLVTPSTPCSNVSVINIGDKYWIIWDNFKNNHRISISMVIRIYFCITIHSEIQFYQILITK